MGRMDMQLTDKSALVSGSTKGIGFAIAVGLAREGARVILNGRSEKAVAEAKAQILADLPKSKIEGFAGDLSTAANSAADRQQSMRACHRQRAVAHRETHALGGPRTDIPGGQYARHGCLQRARIAIAAGP